MVQSLNSERILSNQRFRNNKFVEAIQITYRILPLASSCAPTTNKSIGHGLDDQPRQAKV